MPDGLRNDQEYSTQSACRAHEELKTWPTSLSDLSTRTPSWYREGYVRALCVVELSRQSTDSTRRHARIAGHRSFVLLKEKTRSFTARSFEMRAAARAKLPVSRPLTAAPEFEPMPRVSAAKSRNSHFARASKFLVQRRPHDISSPSFFDY